MPARQAAGGEITTNEMAITDTSPAVTGTSPAETRPATASTGLAAVVGTGDHKTLGRLYLGCSLLLGALALGVLAWGQFEATGDPASQTDRALDNFALGRLGLVFLLVAPFFVGLATAIVPLQVGARTIAFPRAAAAAFWGWLLSSALFLVSHLASVGGGVAGSDGNGVGLTYISLIGIAASLLLGVICLATTVIGLRPPGMYLDRVPFFSWSIVVVAGIWVLTFPAFVVNVVLLFMDQKYGAGAFAVEGGPWAQLAWITGPPQVFAFAIPALGVLADITSTLSGARQPQRGALLAAIGAFGAFGFGAYVQPAFNPGAYHQLPFAAQSAFAVLALLGVLAGIGGAARKGKVSLKSPTLLGLGGFLVLLLGVVLTVPFGLGRLGLQTSPKAVADVAPGLEAAIAGSPIYTWGLAALVLVGALAVGIGGVFFWASKITGRQLPEALGMLLALGALVGAIVLGAPFLVLGFANKSEGLADSTKAFFGISAVGAVIVLAVALVLVLLIIGNRASVLSSGSPGDLDPWGTGQTLEWATDSPPAPGNFGELATVTSPEPLLDLAEGGD